MKSFVAKREWLAEEGLRLDASAYSGGGLSVRDRLQYPPFHSRPLARVCRAFVESRFTRTYVHDPAHGVPYLTASDMLLADLQGLLQLSIKKTPQLARLTVHSGWILMSCSGTIGRTAMVREDMNGMAASHDVIRLIADESNIRPGYLFAFLTSDPAQAMIRQKTYGSVVQHIEPHHIADLPVPVPEPAFEDRIHGLVQRAADARTEASRLLDEASAYFDGLAGPMPSRYEHARAVGIVSRSRLECRLDAFYQVGWAVESASISGDAIGDMARVISTNRVPRIYVERGVPFVSGIDVFRVRPTVRVRLATFIADRYDARVKASDLAVQGSGQRYGLVGQAAYIGRRMDGWACTHDLFRIRTDDSGLTARIFSYIRSAAGRRGMLRHSYGTSIPHVNPAGIAALRVPVLPPSLQLNAELALRLREQADADEEQAIREVEAWLG